MLYLLIYLFIDLLIIFIYLFLIVILCVLPEAAAGGSGASHTPLPSTGRVMLRSIYSSRDEDDHSSDEELEAAVEDSANDYDPRTNLTGGNEFNASTYQMAVELAPIVRRLSGADETVAEVPRSTSPAGVPTPVQIQALFDAQKAAARSGMEI